MRRHRTGPEIGINRSCVHLWKDSKVERVWFPNEMIDEASCMRVANRMADGSMDLDRNAEFLPVLQALKVEADKKGAQ